MASKKKYEAKYTCKGAIPFHVSDIVGIDNYNILQSGGSIELADDLPYTATEWLDVSEVKSSSKKSSSKKSEESGE